VTEIQTSWQSRLRQRKLRTTFYWITTLALIFTATACQVGPRIETFEQARRPEGITMTIELRGVRTETGRLEGELLEVREDGLLLSAWPSENGGATTKRLVFVSYTEISDIDLDQLDLSVLPEPRGRAGHRPPQIPAQNREKLRLLSRFPQGVSAQILDQLLAAQDQTSVMVVGGN
jgi:hypothetical protein